jgi:hypothetical protein
LTLTKIERSVVCCLSDVFGWKGVANLPSTLPTSRQYRFHADWPSGSTRWQVYTLFLLSCLHLFLLIFDEWGMCARQFRLLSDDGNTIPLQLAFHPDEDDFDWDIQSFVNSRWLGCMHSLLISSIFCSCPAIRLFLP